MTEQSEYRPRPWYLAAPIAAWKGLVGVVLCQHPLTALLVVGWTGRLMRARVLRSWWKQSPLVGQGVAFEAFAAELPLPCTPRTLPNWCVAEPKLGRPPMPPDAAAGGAMRRFLRRALGSLGANMRQGSIATLSIFLLTLPATSLWLYAWVLGWNISFFKLYEQSELGISLGLLGILLFILAMLYVPLAHARQAVTGQWRAFFDFRFNWRLARRNAAVMLPVVLLFAAASLVIMLLRIAPYYIGTGEQFESLSVEQLRQWFDRYHLAAGAVLLPAYVLVWLAVAKAYARAAIVEVTAQGVSAPWRGLEREALSRLQLAPREGRFANNPFLRGTSRTLGRAATAALVVLTGVGWFAVAAEVFIAQFFHYVPGAAWLNHPLVLLPWIRDLPPGLAP